MKKGKIYRHSQDGVRTKFQVVEQWSADLFEIQSLDEYGKLNTGTPWMVNAKGEALGYRGSTWGTSLGWSVVENHLVEFKAIYTTDPADNAWHKHLRFHRSLEDKIVKVLVRLDGDNKTVRLMTLDQLKALL